jgi:Domain of unknown function (DUF1772)
MAMLKALSLVVVAITMTTALAHALELPGKMRLPKEHYLAVQTIYYPGFTVGGIAEPVSLVATALVAFLTPSGSPTFWLIVCAFVALALMHAVYWVLIHPVNNFWLKDVNLQGAGATFFGYGSGRSMQQSQADWTDLRDRWEYSHLARAGLASAAFVLLVIAVTV